MTVESSASLRRITTGASRKRLIALVILGVAISLAVVVNFALEARAATQTISGTVTWGRTVISSGDTLRFDPNQDTTLIMTGNLVINGELEMKPANDNVQHVIEFRGNENNFVGGGMTEAQSDVGLWVLGNGRLDIAGENKPGWAYTWQNGWESSDTVLAAPNTPGNYTNFQSVNGTQPQNALGYRPELLNLTRNVVIRGTSSNYTHIFIRSNRPSTIKDALIRYVAPDFGGSDITGRYGIHFHHNGNGSRGTLVEGVVIRDTKNHAFVPHESAGITFRDVIAYNVRGEAYWWDPGDSATDILYDRAVAARVRGANGGENHSLGAFNLGIGSNVSVRNSVVVGMQREGGAQRSGYIWPEDDEATWFFKGNRAHNNEVNGIFVWQNNEARHVIEDFTAYYNGQAGIEHGAYTNSYVYNGLDLRGNGIAIRSHANGERGDGGWTDTQIWANVNTDGGTMVIDEHERDPERPVRFVNCDLGRIDVNDAGGAQPGHYDFINCGLNRNDFDLSGAHPNTVFRVQNSSGTPFRLTGSGSMTNIGKFYNGGPIPGSGSLPAGSFADSIGHTHQTAIEWLAEEGITSGCNPPSNTLFCPDDPVTRGQMAAFIVRARNLSAIDRDFFDDDNGSTFERAINRLATAGITEGCNPPDNDEYCPDNLVNRGQMAAFLVRAFGYTDDGQGDYFDDDDDSVFENAIDKLRVAGVTLGCNPPDNDNYCPDDPVTRGQMATFLRRAMTG